jgi:hypothetical protein
MYKVIKTLQTKLNNNVDSENDKSPYVSLCQLPKIKGDLLA